MVMSESSIVHMSSPRYSFRDETSNLHLPFTSYPFPFYRIYYSWNKNIVHGLKSQKSSIPISSLWLVGGNSENLSREKKNIIFILCIQRTQILKGWYCQEDDWTDRETIWCSRGNRLFKGYTHFQDMGNWAMWKSVKAANCTAYQM